MVCDYYGQTNKTHGFDRKRTASPGTGASLDPELPAILWLAERRRRSVPPAHRMVSSARYLTLVVTSGERRPGAESWQQASRPPWLRRKTLSATSSSGSCWL